MAWLNCSSWPIDGNIESTTTLGLSGPGSDSNDEVFYCPEISWSGVSPSDCLVSYLGDTFGGRGLRAQQWCSWRIVPPQPTGLIYIYIYIYVCVCVWVCVCVCVCVCVRERESERDGVFVSLCVSIFNKSW